MQDMKDNLSNLTLNINHHMTQINFKVKLNSSQTRELKGLYLFIDILCK